METLLKKITDYVVHVADPEQIILFGSFASGRNNVHSDIDLLVITPHVYHRKALAGRVEHFIAGFSLHADVLVYTSEEVAGELRKPLSFVATAVREGKIIFKKTA